MKKRDVINSVQKDERTAARSAKARGYARFMVFVLFGLSLTAIWQDKRLAPPVHDGMQLAAGYAMDYINGNEMLSEVVTSAKESYARLSEDG